jgi:hypothetical protein
MVYDWGGENCWLPEASTAVIAKVKLPADVGVPDSVPSGLSASPEGSKPVLTKNATGGIPPVAVIVVGV